MQDWADQVLATLRPNYPDWDIWVVRMYPAKSTVWCARPAGAPVATINAASPEDLVAQIKEQSES